MMLIVNADDFGRDRVATDTCMECFRQERITSASIMVFMEDTKRAVELALHEKLETGLHLNFCVPYTAQGIPEGLRKVQRLAAGFFRLGPWTQAIYNPFIVKAFALAFNHQLDEYRRLFGREPAHFNGHRHFHLSLNMIVGGLLPSGAAVRRSFSFTKAEKSVINRFYRRLVDAWLTRRYLSTDSFFSLSPLNDSARVSRIFRLAQTSCVELMVHTWDPSQFAYLISGQFRLAISAVQLGNYSSLSLLKPEDRKIKQHSDL